LEKDIKIPVRDGTTIPARVVAPEQAPPHGSPLVVFFHGGGFCMGDFRDETPCARSFAQALKTVTVLVGYRLAPEHPFPTGIDDAYDALKWVRQYGLLILRGDGLTMLTSQRQLRIANS